MPLGRPYQIAFTEPAAKPSRYGRGTDLDTARTTEQYEAREQARQRREQLDGFAQAVRSKERWFFKILDGRDLGAKWAAEAQLNEGSDLDATIRCVVTLAALFLDADPQFLPEN
jgi:hypothetical protein